MRDRRRHKVPSQRYPRTARLNEALREVVAEELELVGDDDDRLRMVTVTGIETEPDLRHATVYFTSLGEDTGAALADQRIRLQGAIARQLRLKRTPHLSFTPDPGEENGRRIDDILRGLEPGRDDE